MEGLHDMDDVRPFYNSDDENDTDGKILSIRSEKLSLIMMQSRCKHFPWI